MFADGSFELYEDDGVSYGYEKGEFSRIPIRYDESSGELTIGARVRVRLRDDLHHPRYPQRRRRARGGWTSSRDRIPAARRASSAGGRGRSLG